MRTNITAAMCTKPSTIGLCAVFLMHLGKRREFSSASLYIPLEEKFVTLGLWCCCRIQTCLPYYSASLQHRVLRTTVCSGCTPFLLVANYSPNLTFLLFIVGEKEHWFALFARDNIRRWIRRGFFVCVCVCSLFCLS